MRTTTRRKLAARTRRTARSCIWHLKRPAFPSSCTFFATAIMILESATAADWLPLGKDSASIGLRASTWSRPTNNDGEMGKRILFRAAAVVLGLLPLLVGELALRGLGLGKPQDANDPFIGFSDIHPLFVLNEETG